MAAPLSSSLPRCSGGMNRFGPGAPNQNGDVKGGNRLTFLKVRGLTPAWGRRLCAGGKTFSWTLSGSQRGSASYTDDDWTKARIYLALVSQGAGPA